MCAEDGCLILYATKVHTKLKRKYINFLRGLRLSVYFVYVFNVKRDNLSIVTEINRIKFIKSNLETQLEFIKMYFGI